MINTLKPGSTQGHSEVKGEILDRLSKQYGAEEKNRDPVKKLGKDEFFKIMVTQMQHQDPTKPMQNEEMAAQMAQFSSLEQMLNVNQNIEKLAQAQLPLQQLGAAGLIGKYVTADSSRVLHTDGKLTDFKFELPNDASHLKVVVLNDKGENVSEFEMNDAKKGENKITWDGKKPNKMSAGSGQYMIQVAAEDDRGRPMQVNMTKTEVVHGVGFDGKETVLYTGNPKSPHKMLLKNVSRIVDPGQGGSAGAAVAAAEPENPFQAMIDAQKGQQQKPDEIPELEEQVPNTMDIGKNSKFSPFKLNDNEQSQLQKAKMDADRQLRREEEMNPAARMAADGQLGGKADVMEINPAAQKFATNLKDIPEMDTTNSASQENSAARNLNPSSEDGSIAGELNE